MKRKKCEECDGKIIRKEVEVIMYGVTLWKFLADVCNNYGEEVFDEKVSEEIDRIAKKKGLWGLAKKIKVVKIVTL